MLNPGKTKVIFAQWNDIRDEIDKARAEQSKREGREISEAEFLRTLTLNFANKRLKARGKKPLDLDPKSAPGGITAAPRDVRRSVRSGAETRMVRARKKAA